MDEPISVPAEAVLSQVTAQRDKAMTDLAVAQAAVRQLSQRVAELERQQSNGTPATTGVAAERG